MGKVFSKGAGKVIAAGLATLPGVGTTAKIALGIAGSGIDAAAQHNEARKYRKKHEKDLEASAAAAREELAGVAREKEAEINRIKNQIDEEEKELSEDELGTSSSQKAEVAIAEEQKAILKKIIDLCGSGDVLEAVELFDKLNNQYFEFFMSENPLNACPLEDRVFMSDMLNHEIKLRENKKYGSYSIGI